MSPVQSGPAPREVVGRAVVLEEAGVIRGSDLWNDVEAPTRSYVTEVAKDAAVASLLKATQPLDDVA